MQLFLPQRSWLINLAGVQEEQPRYGLKSSPMNQKIMTSSDLNICSGNHYEFLPRDGFWCFFSCIFAQH